MRLTATVKLQPTPAQATALRDTLERANAACNRISAVAWQHRTFGQYKLHHAVYHELKAATGLTAQVIVRCIAKVADAYKIDKKTKRTFRPVGAIAYDDRILRWTADVVSIWTTSGRQMIPFVCGDHARALLASRQGESDLFTRDGAWFLSFTANVEEPPAKLPDTYLGIDLGIINLAVDSDGQTYSGATVNGMRHRHRRLRRKLQAKRSRAARRLLKKRRRKEHRFAKDINHRISKAIVATAQGTGRGIALEDLRGIRERVSASRSQRATFQSWSFGQLRQFVVYKAALVGIPVVLVDPRNTSRTCPACGCIDQKNRVSQAAFCCVACGFAGPADHIAAENIRRAAVNRPDISEGRQGVVPPGTSSPALAGSR